MGGANGRWETLVQSATDSIIKNNLFQRIYRYFQQSNVVRNDKKIDFSIIRGPHFSKDTKLGLGIVASGLYRLDRTDMSLSPSNISLYGDITTTGFYLLGIDGNTIFPRDLYRLDVNMYFFLFSANTGASNPTFYQLYIPMFMWFSESYQRDFPEKVGYAVQNKAKPVATNAVFHTMLDVAFIQTPYLQPGLSLVSPDFQISQRMYLNDHDKPIFFL